MKNYLYFLKALKDPLYLALTRIWLIGTLFRTSRKNYANALYEFIYVVLWSVLPFFLGGLVKYVISSDPDKNFIDLIISTFRDGELLVFTISLVAPTLYFALHDPEGADMFPHKLPLSTIGALVIVTCAALFALLKASSVHDQGFVFALSVWLTIAAFVIRFLGMLYHRGRLVSPNEKQLRSNEHSFVDRFNNHLEQQ